MNSEMSLDELKEISFTQHKTANVSTDAPEARNAEQDGEHCPRN